MSKTIKIGGRIESAEQGGVVTGANVILDDTKGKKQNVINSETDDELARLDSTKQDVLTFDNAPTEGSNNPVKSGGVYAADAALQQAIEAILLLIPSAASALNQLADKAFVNSTVATDSATFRGTYNVVTDLSLHYDATHQQIATALLSKIQTADNNDYCFVQIPVSDSSGDIRVTERYKFNGTAWSYEYDLNNSGFTAAQWAAINSTITQALVEKLGALPTAADLAIALNGKQNTLTFDTTPIAGSSNPVTSAGLYAAFQAINATIPAAASADNKLVAETRLAEYVAAIINALDATYNVTSTDGHVNVRLTQVDGVITSLEVLTSDIASAADVTALTTRVSTNEEDIAQLQAAYEALTQSTPVIVEPTDTWPVAAPQEGVIYRVIDRVNTPPQNYSDYMYNGTAMVLMGTYDNAIDDIPTPGSNNLVKSGGVASHIVYDISEANVVGSILATYADLAAALGNNGANIPPSIQKGGMSVKFIQSSDNKYVQYRLMKNTWSTTESDWQSMNVDEVPVAASSNLVKSGGVSEELYGLVVKDETVTYTGFKNKVYSPISAGEKYEIQITSETSFKVTVQVNTTNSYVVLEEITDSEKHYITIPQNLVGTTLYFTATDITVHLRLIRYRANSIKEIIDKTKGNVATLNTSMTNEEEKSDVIFDDLLYIASAVKKLDSDVNNRILFNKEYVNNSETDWILKKITWYAKDNSCKFYVCILKPTITTGIYYILSELYIGSSVVGLNEKEVDILVPTGCCVGIHGTKVEGDTMPEWGNQSPSGTLGCMHNTFSDISHVSAGSTISLVDLTRSTAYGCLFAKESFLSEGQPYVIKRVVAVNQNNYNSIRDVVNRITDASPSKIYHVIVPKGRWFESDLSGKPYVKIIGEDREESIIYCDGDADKPLPSNYAGGDYDEKSDFSYSDSLAETKKIYKHCVYCAAETYISNLRIEAHNTKYCVHIDSTHCNKAVFDNCHIYAIKDGTVAKELNHPIGIGLRGGQSVEIKNCIIESEIVGIGVFAHNFANSTSGCKLSIQNCYFKNCGYLKTGELGSGQNDIFELLNCTSDLKMVQAEVDATTSEENPQNVPYSIKVNACGTDVVAVQTPVVKGVVSRPDFVHDLMSNYAIAMAKSDVPSYAVGKVYTGYMVIKDKYIRVRLASSEPQYPIVGVVFNVSDTMVYLVPKGHVAMIPKSVIVGDSKTGTVYVDTNGYVTTDIASSVTDIGAIGVLYTEYNTSDYVYLAMF